MSIWLSIKAAAGREPEYVSAIDRQQQLGPDATIQDAILYNRLLERHPRVPQRHNEDIASHFERLKNAEQRYQETRVAPGMEQRQKARDEGKIRTPAPIDATPTMPWAGDLPTAVTDLKGLPQRVPGWYTGDGMRDSEGELLNPPPPGYGTPPMSRRDPGATFRTAPPPRQTYDEWVQSLKDKGVWLNPDGSRMTQEQMDAPLPRRKSPSWADLTHPANPEPDIPSRTPGEAKIDTALKYYPERSWTLGPSLFKRLFGSETKTSPVVREYVAGVLEKVAATPEPLDLHNTMTGEGEQGGWSFKGHYPGASNSMYWKTIGDKTHVIAKDGHEWLHYTAPVGEFDEFGEPAVEDEATPIGFPTLGQAYMHAMQGKMHAGFSSKMTNEVADSSYQPGRVFPTAPMGRLLPPAADGKYQTLSSNAWEQR